MKRLNLVVWKYSSALLNPINVPEPKTLRVERLCDFPKSGELFLLREVDWRTSEATGVNWLCRCDSVHAVELQIMAQSDDSMRVTCWGPVTEATPRGNDCAALISFTALSEFRSPDYVDVNAGEVI